jgi:hypothetical protein
MIDEFKSPLRMASLKAVEERIAAALTELTGKPLECHIHGFDFTGPGFPWHENAKIVLTINGPSLKFDAPEHTAPAGRRARPEMPRPPAYNIDAHRERSIAEKEAEIQASRPKD